MKFFLFIALVVTGWYVLGWVQQQVDAGRKAQQRRSRVDQPRRHDRATDTTVCSRCGAYVPADFPTACARADCPFPGVG
jgi:hypothetical protein